MANTKSAIKAIRVTKRRTELNREIKEAYRSVKREIRKNIESGDIKSAESLMPKYQSEIDKALKKGLLKKNTVARYKSRVSAFIKQAKSK